jgi:hypothetical protein
MLVGPLASRALSHLSLSLTSPLKPDQGVGVDQGGLDPLEL